MPNSCRSHQTDKQVNFANSYGTHILSQPDLADTRSLGDEEALFARRDLIALLVDNSNRTPSGTWFERHRRHSGDLEHASFGLPPGIGDRTRAVTDHIVEAAPSLRVDGLANRTEYAQTGQIVFAHPGVAKAHESANSGWSGVEASDAVVLNELPPAVGVWVRRTALMHEDGGTVEQRAVDEVGVSVNPARISSTSPAVLFLNVEVLLEGDVGANLVATMGMNDGLRLAGESRGVQNE